MGQNFVYGGAQISSRKFDPKQAPKSHKNLIEIRSQGILEYFKNTLYSHSPNKGQCTKRFANRAHDRTSSPPARMPRSDVDDCAVAARGSVRRGFIADEEVPKRKDRKIREPPHRAVLPCPSPCPLSGVSRSE
jgi:hypothetical protein